MSRITRIVILTLVSISLEACALAQPPINSSDPYRYLNRPCNPYYPHRDFPKLITPQWVGEPGVEAVIVLAIDDMRGHEKWEAYLRPILDRLKKIDGRAPVSIMTCQVDPQHPHLQQWLNEGLSLEIHTVDHPCPLLKDGDFAKSKSTYDRCVNLLNQVPNNKPVAFRMPCCDSLNTLSPRFFTEIFNKTTDQGHFLQIDTSVFQVFTSDDPALPRELVLNAAGRERFKRYLPADRTFVNSIENYPYPYVIDHLCWEFPCLTPSDWAAQHKQKPNNPLTVEDWKAAIDCTVIKQGVLNLVFHPHGWIKSEQVVEMIDHAVQKHGKKVKFLTFQDALQRLNQNFLKGTPLRNASGAANPIHVADTNHDGFIDAVQGDAPHSKTTLQQQATLPVGIGIPNSPSQDHGLRYYDLDEDGFEDLIFSDSQRYAIALWSTETNSWSRQVLAGKRGDKADDDELPPIVRADGTNNGFWIHSGLLVWQNEDTATKTDLIDRRSIKTLLRDVEAGPKTPGQGLASLKVRPGFRVELMAAEPLTMDPVAFEWGPDGKLWVAEMADYPRGIDGEGRPGGRIRFLEDQNSDGVYETSTLFLDHVSFPTGVMPWKNGVLVSTAPDIFYAEDTDGDGKADKRDVLYTGFAPGNQQHRVNGLVWGRDNWVYLANGDSGGVVKSLKTGKSVDIRGRDVRINPASGDVDTVTGQTQFGRNRDDWGNWYGCNNANPMYQFVLEDRYLRRNTHFSGTDPRRHVSNAPGTAPCFPQSITRARFNDLHTANRFTSACSTMVYRDTLFGAAFSSSCFVSEPVHNLVHREVLSRQGAVFNSQRDTDEQQSEFLASTDNWCRPTMIKTGPDGALWVADMYRHVIEHPEWIPLEWQKRLDLRAGHDKGRLYRVYPAGVRPRSIPRLDKLSNLELVQILDRPEADNGWVRDTVQKLLIERTGTDVIAPLKQIAMNSSRPLSRLHALCTLDGLDGLGEDVLLTALNHTEPQLRRQGIRLCERLKARSAEMLAKLNGLASDPDELVRMQLACSLGEFSELQASGILGRLLVTAHQQPYVYTAAMSSLHPQNIDGVLLTVLKESDTAAHDAEFLKGLLQMAVALSSETAEFRLLDAATRPQQGNWENWQFRTVAVYLRSMDLSRRKQLSKRLKASEQPEAQRAVIQLQSLLSTAAELAPKSDLPLDERLAAIQVLAIEPSSLEPDLRLLSSLLDSSQPPEIRSAVVSAIGQSDSGSAVALLLTPWKSYSPTLKNLALDQILSRADGVSKLIESLEKQVVEANSLDATRRQRLLSTNDRQLRGRAAKVLAANFSTREQVLRSYEAALMLGADISNGQMLFMKTCAPCHKLAGAGHEVGPDLAALTDKSPESLLVAILDPNRAVESKFLNYTVITKGGRTLNGMLSAETGNSVTLKGAEAKEDVILRSEIEELVSSSRSTMPEGLEKDLKPQELADIIAFVRANVSLPKRKQFVGNVPAVVAGGSGGALELTSKTCEIYGPTIILEEKYGNLGYWSSDEDMAVWSIEVKRPGKYNVTFDYACENSSADQIWQLNIGARSLTGKVLGTGTWDDYRRVDMGQIDLDTGRHQVTLRSAGKITKPLLDLKTIRLTP